MSERNDFFLRCHCWSVDQKRPKNTVYPYLHVMHVRRKVYDDMKARSPQKNKSTKKDMQQNNITLSSSTWVLACNAVALSPARHRPSSASQNRPSSCRAQSSNLSKFLSTAVALACSLCTASCSAFRLSRNARQRFSRRETV